MATNYPSSHGSGGRASAAGLIADKPLRGAQRDVTAWFRPLFRREFLSRLYDSTPYSELAHYFWVDRLLDILNSLQIRLDRTNYSRRLLCKMLFPNDSNDVVPLTKPLLLNVDVRRLYHQRRKGV